MGLAAMPGNILESKILVETLSTSRRCLTADVSAGDANAS